MRNFIYLTIVFLFVLIGCNSERLDEQLSVVNQNDRPENTNDSFQHFSIELDTRQ